jgi:hypothetical protein
VHNRHSKLSTSHEKKTRDLLDGQFGTALLKAAVNEERLNTGIFPLNTNMCIDIPFGIFEIRSVENPVP